jgi:hypothetical protein
MGPSSLEELAFPWTKKLRYLAWDLFVTMKSLPSYMHATVNWGMGTTNPQDLRYDTTKSFNLSVNHRVPTFAETENDLGRLSSSQCKNIQTRKVRNAPEDGFLLCQKLSCLTTHYNRSERSHPWRCWSLTWRWYPLTLNAPKGIHCESDVAPKNKVFPRVVTCRSRLFWRIERLMTREVVFFGELKYNQLISEWFVLECYD